MFSVITCYFQWYMPQSVQFPDGNTLKKKKKKIVFSMGEKWLTKVAQHDLMEEKINGACKA